MRWKPAADSKVLPLAAGLADPAKRFVKKSLEAMKEASPMPHVPAFVQLCALMNGCSENIQ